MADAIISRKLRNRTRSQRRASKQRQKVATSQPVVNLVTLPDMPPSRTCIKCLRDIEVSLEQQMEITRFTCEDCERLRQQTKQRMKVQRRLKRVRLATPKWADLDAIKNIHEQCKLKTKATGIRHEVDHLVPLVSKFVCGLNLPINLRIITAKENRKKSNSFDSSAV